MKTKFEVILLIEVTALITFMITMSLCYFLTQNLREELRALRAEHEAIEQNYCPTCGTYLGEIEDGNVD